MKMLDTFYLFFDEDRIGFIQEEKFCFLYFSMIEANLLKKHTNNSDYLNSIISMRKEFREFEGKISIRFFKLFFFNKSLVSFTILHDLIEAAKKLI